jgi:hypothetical protein
MMDQPHNVQVAQRSKKRRETTRSTSAVTTSPTHCGTSTGAKTSAVAAESRTQIGYAIMVQPAPVPGESFDTTGRWRVIIEVFNSGPADAKTILLTLHTPPPDAFLHSPPMIMSDAGAAKIDIKPRDPDGIYQVEITNLIKGDELMLKMLYQVPDDHKKEFMDQWKQGGIFDASFGKRFIGHFFFTGEHLSVSNYGAMPMKADFADQN